MSSDQYFAPGSTDEIISQHLRDGDVVLINRRCTSLGNPFAAALCLMSKYGLSGEGRQCWDHAAIVVHDRGVPYLLEGGSEGVKMRTFEERLLQGKDHQEMTVLPLRTATAGTTTGSADEERRATALGDFVKELGLARTADGFDGSGAVCCQNTWATYRALRLPFSKRRLPASASPATPSPSSSAASASPAGASTCCSFGAPLIATALQRLGVLDNRIDSAMVTPAALPTLPISEPAHFGQSVPVRNLN